MAVDNSIVLGVGNCSKDKVLGPYYQDFKAAIAHFEQNNLGNFDAKGIPYLVEEDRNYYSVVYVIQYALIQFEFIYEKNDLENREKIVLNCLNWIEENAEEFHGCIVWRSEANHHYHLDKGWISSMYQGQAISLFLRAYQHFNEVKYLDLTHRIFPFFDIEFKDGGVKRIDENGFLWYEEYPTDPPSFVLNGFVYTIFGILDYYRVTGDEKAKKLYDECIKTLVANVKKYDRFYWTVYDQLKLELVSYYYQKNVHIPLMQILFELTGEKIFKDLNVKWTKQLNNPIYKLLVKVMYRVQPRLIKLIK